MIRSLVLSLAVSGLSACALPLEREPDAPGTSPAEIGPEPVRPPRLSPHHGSAWHESQGFVVHEWGTFTSVLASDGSRLPGLHHEEEDLPGFVADRMAQAEDTPGVVSQKMETPVTYFYSPRARTVTAAVHFPKGIFTQWYPYVRATAPALYLAESGIIDPWLWTDAPVPTQCVPRFAAGFRDGLLDWGEVEVLPPHDSAALPGPLGDTTWRFARNTRANPLRLTGPKGDVQTEKFLFYRGLGDFELPLRATLTGDGTATSVSVSSARGTLGALLLMRVEADGAGFVELGDVAEGQTLTSAVPAPTLTHGAFVAALKERLVAALVGDGLYADEAQAMVDTWERSYFLTPGVRLLYLLPQAQTDEIIPLAIAPAPDALARTMVIRAELLTPALEEALLADASALATPGERDRAKASLLRWGRFSEPYLTRAHALLRDAGARAAVEELLKEVRRNRRWAPLSAE